MRLIDEVGTQMGVVPVKRAQALAKERGLDLVEVAPNANPPVCRILDYGKYKYEQEKQERDTKKKHKQSELKTIRLRPNIGKHDIDVKIRNASEFLKEGDKIKFTVIFRSREITRPDNGRRLLEQIAEALQEHGAMDRPPIMEGRMMSMFMVPKKRTDKPVAEPKETSNKVEAGSPAPEQAEASPVSGGDSNAENQNQQNGRETIQADGERQTDAQTRVEQPPVSEQSALA